MIGAGSASPVVSMITRETGGTSPRFCACSSSNSDVLTSLEAVQQMHPVVVAT